MDELLTEVQALADAEYERAAEKFGRVNNSRHESYAVILEEFEEAQDLLEIIKLDMEILWTNTKSNSERERILDHLKTIRTNAECAAAEWIQVAAMAYKAELTELEKGGERE